MAELRRIALAHQHYGFEGSLDREFVLLAESLVKRDLEIHVYCNPARRTHESDGVTFHDVVPHTTPTDGRLRLPLHLIDLAVVMTRALRRDRTAYDLINVSGLTAWEHDVVTAHSVTRADQRRWAVAARGTYRAPRARSTFANVAKPRGMVVRTLERLQFRPGHYRRVIARTPQVAEDLVADHGVPGELIDVIHYPATIDPKTPRDRSALRELGIGNEPIVLFLGHDFARKGLSEAIGAFSGLDGDAKLVVVGGGDRNPFVRLARELGVSDRVVFAGPTTSPQRFFAAADVFLHPARRETWGMPVIEAMLLGVPVIVSESAGVASEVVAAGAGLVVPPGSNDAIRAAVRSVLANPEHRSELGRNGRSAARRFLPDEIARETAESFRSAFEAGAALPFGVAERHGSQERERVELPTDDY